MATLAALVTAVVQVQSLAQELLHATGTAGKKKREETKTFSDKQKLREFVANRPALHGI